MKYSCICKASVLGYTMPFISSKFTKEVIIPATSAGEKDCAEIVNENLIGFLALYSGNYMPVA